MHLFNHTVYVWHIFEENVHYAFCSSGSFALPWCHLAASESRPCHHISSQWFQHVSTTFTNHQQQRLVARDMFFTLTLVSMLVVVPVSGLHSVISNSSHWMCVIVLVFHFMTYLLTATHFEEYPWLTFNINSPGFVCLLGFPCVRGKLVMTPKGRHLLVKDGLIKVAANCPDDSGVDPPNHFQG